MLESEDSSKNVFFSLHFGDSEDPILDDIPT